MRSKQYNYIIGSTSLWLFIPIFKGFNIYNNISTIIMLLNTCICMIISTVMWSNYDNKSLIYKLDLLFATIQFILLNIVNIINNYINYNTQIVLSSLTLLFYFTTNLFYKRKKWLSNILSHLIFRYFGYLFCHLILINKCYYFLNIIILTFIYYFHILLSLTLLNCNYKYHIYIVSVMMLFIIIFDIY